MRTTRLKATVHTVNATAANPGDPPSGANPRELRLEVVAGPPIDPLVFIPTPEGQTVGRSSSSDQRLPDTAVSRSHCRVRLDGAAWSIQDLGSRHGTLLNGVKLEPDRPAHIESGDQVRIGPWTFRARVPGFTTMGMTTTDDSAGRRVQRVPAVELRTLAQQRLDHIIDCAASINGAPDVQALSSIVLDAVIGGAGFSRAAIVRQLSGDVEVEIVAYRGPEGEDAGDISISRSLLSAAAEGQVVRLMSDALPEQARYGQSIADLNIHSALCLPIMLGTSVEAMLYLDARGAEAQVRGDAAAFCQVISRLCGLALSNLKRLKLERDQRQLESDLGMAREAQRLIMPPVKGDAGCITYAMENEPGRLVAGDLFDVVPLDKEGRVAVFLGDVTGKGVGAAITMASAQTHLRVALATAARAGEVDPAAVVMEVNRYIAQHIRAGLFISLWLGVFDITAGMVRYVDAGHGHWLVRRPGHGPERVENIGCIPIGLDADRSYLTESMPLEPGTRVILFSDGVTEQTGAGGEGMFGFERALAALSETGSAAEDVAALAGAVRLHAGVAALSDDLTVASVECLRG